MTAKQVATSDDTPTKPLASDRKEQELAPHGSSAGSAGASLLAAASLRWCPRACAAPVARGIQARRGSDAAGCSVAPRRRAGEAWRRGSPGEGRGGAAVRRPFRGSAASCWRSVGGEARRGREGAALPTGPPPPPPVGLCGTNRVKTGAGRAEKTALRPTSRPKPGTATVSASSPSPELQETKAPLSTAQRPPPLLSGCPVPPATDGPVLRRAVRAAAEPRARQVLPPRRRRRGGRLHQPAPQLAERGVEGALLPRLLRPVPAPPQRRLRPLPRRHGHAGAGLVPRLPRRAARLRPSGGAGDHVAGHQGGAGLGRGVLLQNARDRYLRANGKYLRWNTGVTVESRDIENAKVSSMMRWIVEPVDLTERAPRIPDPIRARLPEDLSVVVFGRQPGALRGIRLYPEAQQGWAAFHVRPCHYGVNQQPEGIAMCVRAGRYGRLTPLVVDLPRRGWGDIFQIVVIISRTREPLIGDHRSGECNRPTAAVFGEPSTGDHGSGECNSPTAAVFAEPSQVGSQSHQPVQRELLRNPSGSTGQSLTEHPDVSVEVARANLQVAASRCRSIRKEASQARDRLVQLQQQNIGALPKVERKAVIKEIRKLIEKMTKLEEAAALANEEFAKEQDKVTRAELRHGV